MVETPISDLGKFFRAPADQHSRRTNLRALKLVDDTNYKRG